jgi:hypothetical protein
MRVEEALKTSHYSKPYLPLSISEFFFHFLGILMNIIIILTRPPEFERLPEFLGILTE